jgi:hypothetical protein
LLDPGDAGRGGGDRPGACPDQCSHTASDPDQHADADSHAASDPDTSSNRADADSDADLYARRPDRHAFWADAAAFLDTAADLYAEGAANAAANVDATADRNATTTRHPTDAPAGYTIKDADALSERYAHARRISGISDSEWNDFLGL